MYTYLEVWALHAPSVMHCQHKRLGGIHCLTTSKAQACKSSMQRSASTGSREGYMLIRTK